MDYRDQETLNRLNKRVSQTYAIYDKTPRSNKTFKKVESDWLKAVSKLESFWCRQNNL